MGTEVVEPLSAWVCRCRCTNSPLLLVCGWCREPRGHTPLFDFTNEGVTCTELSDEAYAEEDLAPDPVHSPHHYNRHGIECIQAIQASMSREEYQGYLKGNTMKYLWRYKYKGNPVQDLEKAQWYLDALLNNVENPNNGS